MSREARRAVVAALVGLAGSADYRDRADAGRGLASFAETAEARSASLALVLDAGDMFVTRATAEALLRRRDAVGLAVVASALGVADPQHAEWIYTAVVDVFGVFSRERDAAVRECAVLSGDPDERVRRGADELTGMLAEIDPILYPAQGGQTR
jgi:predicted phosphoribosyltransferase